MDLKSVCSGLQIVFISMCHSGGVGRWFTELGVPHVICVEQSEKVKDSHAIDFARHFYEHLFGGGTVADSFNRARIGKFYFIQAIQPKSFSD